MVHSWGRHRILSGDGFQLAATASVATQMSCRIVVQFDDGRISPPYELLFTSPSDGSVGAQNFGGPIEADGYVVRAITTGITAVKRGQTYVEMAVVDPNARTMDILGRDYLHPNNQVVLDVFNDTGPGGGQGVVNLTIADDIAPVDITHPFAATNRLRRIDGFIWYYEASSDVATRTLRASVRSMGQGLPTNFTSGGNSLAQLWPSAGALSLTANQQGTMLVLRDSFAVSVDNGAAVWEDFTTAPNPFPYWASESDVGEFFFDVSAEEANDRHSIYIIQEEWIDF